MRVGRRLAIKLLNASKFVLSRPDPNGPATAVVDRGLLSSLSLLVDESTADLEAYNYTRVLERSERFFWGFCDDYLELVKGRRYGDQGAELAASANGALLMTLSVVLRLFAPFLPFATEEVWSWWRPGSVHRAPWPTAEELASHRGDPAILAVTGEVLSAVRKAKSDAKASMRAEVSLVSISAADDRLDLVRQAEADLQAAARAEQVTYAQGDPDVAVVLAEV
jgi:valyl-tRNA synthetase